jgi:methionyl-tRNA formyltransferase
MHKYMLVIGNDKLGRRLLARLGDPVEQLIVVDQSTDFQRVWKLIRRGSLQLSWVIQMAWAEWRRSDTPVGKRPAIFNNDDLLRLIQVEQLRRIYLFRAGLIVNRKVLESGVEVLNVHCARLPAYGGLGSIARALAAGAYEQEATLHRVTTRIDDGEVLATEPYQLHKALSYGENEERAYEAGIKLLCKELATAAEQKEN